jgi:exodeoxyribonuclease VII large subunit
MAERLPEPALPQVISVAELNRIARELLERNLPLMWVAGEVSNFKRYESGHCYFTLKDGAAQVDCVMFRHRAQLAGWLPQDGMRVEVRAVPTLYEARGKFQLNVEAMRRAGLGALFEAFERLKARLEQEGLFDPERKRPLPRFPRAVGVVTSLQAAALRDVLTTLARRMPRLPVILYPAPVQGEGAGERIAAAIGLAGARGDCDVLILCRGGGSIEDLWAFNEEPVARAVRDCPLPVVTGIGHETDFTIADFAADARAPTPTAAAALASPARDELASALSQDARRLLRAARRQLEARMQGVDFLSRRLIHPGERIRNQLGELRHLAHRLVAAWARGLEDLGAQARVLGAQLKHLNPQSVLERGYSITENAAGAIVRNGAQLAVGEDVTITFAKGRVGARVSRKG